MSQMDQEQRQYDYLESLSMDRLEEQMYQCSEDDPELLDKIVEVIVKKEKEDPTGRLMDVDAAWAEFKAHYMPLGKAESNLHCNDNARHLGGAAVNIGNPPESLQPKHRCSGFARGVLSAVVLFSAIFIGMIAVQAAGFDLFGSLARWTDEVLQFTSGTMPARGEDPSVVDIADSSNSLQAALIDKGFSADLAPAWLPEGFSATDVNAHIARAFDKVSCHYDGPDSFLDIQFIKYKDNSLIDAYFFEKDSELVEEYISNDRLFYLVSNIDQQTATWTGGDLQIKIASNLSSDTLKTIIDSIGG